MNTFTSFDGTRIAYHDRGEGPAVILLHGFGPGALASFGPFEQLQPTLAKINDLFRAEMGFAPPMPEPPLKGRPGLISRLFEAGARVIAPDMRGFGASDKPHEEAAYAGSAFARDVCALIAHLGLEAVDVLGFSMGSGTAAKLLALRPPQVKSAVLAGVGDYILEGVELKWPEGWPRPGHWPKPLTVRAHARMGADVLERGEIIPGDLMSANVILARATSADPLALAAVMRGEVAEQVRPEALSRVKVPVLVINGRADAANQATKQLLGLMPNARSASCDGDHYSTLFEPSFHEAVIAFLREQWQARISGRTAQKDKTDFIHK